MDLRNNIADGLEFVKTAAGTATAQSMPVNLIFPTITPANILSIPVISGGQRVVVQTDLGQVGNPSSLLIGFYNSGAASGTISKMLPSTSVALNTGTTPTTNSNPSTLGYNLYLNNSPVASSLPLDLHTCLLLVSDNYQNTLRFNSNAGGGSPTSSYGVVSGSYMLFPPGKTYSDIGVGVLIGWYGAQNQVKTSAFGIGPLGSFSGIVQCESVWLSQSGANTTFNVALTNINPTGNCVTTPTGCYLALIR